MAQDAYVEIMTNLRAAAESKGDKAKIAVERYDRALIDFFALSQDKPRASGVR